MSPKLPSGAIGTVRWVSWSTTIVGPFPFGDVLTNHTSGHYGVVLLPMEGNMCSMCLTGFKNSSVNHLNALGDESVCSGMNTFQSARCRFLSAVLLIGLLAFTLTGCATTGSSVCSSDQRGPRDCGACASSGSGCRNGSCQERGYRDDKPTACQIAAACDVPRELRKSSLPEYQIEIPDILLIEAMHNLRPADAIINAGEPLVIQANCMVPIVQQENSVSREFKEINDIYVIGIDGYLNLGPEYGKVLVAEQNLAEIQRRTESHLLRIFKDGLQVLVTLPNPQNKQVVAGQHLVRMDGTVGLGIYGAVYVNGMTLSRAKNAVERHLSKHIHNPQVSLDVLAYNSKKYYVVIDGGGAGEQVIPLPCTGNETVLDALASIQGLPNVASKANIWVARPAPGCNNHQVLPVDWNAIVQGAQPETNYQVMPGDRIYVKADKMIALDTAVAKITTPLERLLGVTILGNGAYRTLQVGRAAFVGGN